MGKKSFWDSWNIDKSAELYALKDWGAGYYGIDSQGNLTIRVQTPQGLQEIPFTEIISGITERGMNLPVLLRIENFLDSQISKLNLSFKKAMEAQNYTNVYRGVYPIKVNQQEQVLHEITRFGAQYHHGLEAGSKAELIAALGIMEDPEACLICNGYKDEEFIDLALNAIKMGYKVFLVLEMPMELELIIKRSRALGIEPKLGVRFKLSARAGGHWSESGGDRSLFGLSSTQVIQVVDRLKDEGLLHCLELLHFHLGSQVPNIRDIRRAVLEAARLYGGLVKEGAPMGHFDLGGGLAVDYDGSQTNYEHSRNYGLDEYTYDIIEQLISVFDQEGVDHPVVLSESGRATVAYYSVLLVNVLDVTRFEPQPLPEKLPEDTPDTIVSLYDVLQDMSRKNLQECFNDALYFRDQSLQLYQHGQITLRQRSLMENIFLTILHKISNHADSLKRLPPGLEGLNQGLSDIYYANFSVFQSLPDAWAIDQVFPVMPITRLNEAPTRQGIIADITCDCDGQINHFISMKNPQSTLPLHEFSHDQEYYLGFFLVGAYQETLGDLHNLLGDTNVVSIRIQQDQTFDIVREIDGDSIADVLSYVEYEPPVLLERFRQKAERAVKQGKISPRERRDMVQGFETSLRGYTYFEREDN
ncbi:MAG: biosynthetic arginine decarboxylase [Spirochaetaceae bacterium]|nr:biosynthetic arginine decarboxylase [Spirochaetaceae bacterium]